MKKISLLILTILLYGQHSFSQNNPTPNNTTDASISVLDREWSNTFYTTLEAKGLCDGKTEEIKVIVNADTLPSYVEKRTIYVQQSGTDTIVALYDEKEMVLTFITRHDSIYFPVDASELFHNVPSLVRIDCSHFNTSHTTTMEKLFAACNYIKYLDLSSFNTEKVTNFSNMFAFCFGLDSVNVSSFDTRNVTNMHQMFDYCGIEGIDLSNFDMSSVTQGDIFDNKSTFNLKWVKTPKAYNRNLSGCLPNIDEGDYVWITPSNTIIDAKELYSAPTNMLIEYKNVRPTLHRNWHSALWSAGINYREITSIKTEVNATSLPDGVCVQTWGIPDSIIAVRTGTELTLHTRMPQINLPYNSYEIFANFDKVTSIDLHNFNTDSTRKIEKMFGMPLLKELDLSALDLSKVEYANNALSEMIGMETLITAQQHPTSTTKAVWMLLPFGDLEAHWVSEKVPSSTYIDVFKAPTQTRLVLRKNTTGLKTESTSIEEILILPNPAVSWIEVRNISDGDWITISDIMGKVIRRERATSSAHRIDLGRLSKGIYIVSVKGERVKLLIS